METLTLSKRGYAVFKRFIEAKFGKVMENAKEATQELETDYALDREYFNDKWKVDLDYCMATHQEHCTNGDSMIYGEECHYCEYNQMEINIRLLYGELGKWEVLEYKCFRASTLTKEILIAWLDWLAENKNAWKFCRCGEVATMNDACDRCYIHGYFRSEEEGGACCVCHENDGRWVKLHCGHILHKHCFIKIKTEAPSASMRKCPLCRSLGDFKTAKEDCYDV